MISYRKEIDGLRAISVVAVIFFHAGLYGFSGGFVGVDVFFVISGYLITSIIISENEKKEFSLFKFYERRARRILPALFLVSALCIIPAWLWLTPKEMKQFSESLIGVSTFTSNIFFWLQSGYFDTASELKPLIHTWSLSIEEQFYLIFPACLSLLFKFQKKRIIQTFFIIFVLSFSLSIYFSYNHSNFSFFNLPTRLWELLIGVFLPFLSFPKKTTSNVTKEIFSLIGLCMILFSIFKFNQATPFPSFYTLAPTIGTALIILFATQKTLIGTLLSMRILSTLGLISYSAYLWHQPLFAFSKLGGFLKNDIITKYILIFITFFFAFLSWEFIEKPFRDPLKISKKKITYFALSFIAILFSIGWWGSLHKGFPEFTIELNPPKPTNILKKDIIVVGDSHSFSLKRGLKQITLGNVTSHAGPGCIPFIDVDRSDNRFPKGYCSKIVTPALKQIIKNDRDALLILHSMGPIYLNKSSFIPDTFDSRIIGQVLELTTNKSIKDEWKIYEIGMRNTFLELSKLNKTKTLFIIDVPEIGIKDGCVKNKKSLELGSFKISDLVTPNTPESCFVSRSLYNERTSRYIEMVKKISSEFTNILLIDPTDLFCDHLKCKGYDSEYGFLYADIDHLNLNGSIFLANYISNLIKDKLN